MMEYPNYHRFEQDCIKWRPHVMKLSELQGSKDLEQYIRINSLPQIKVNTCNTNLGNQIVAVVFNLDEDNKDDILKFKEHPLGVVDPKRGGMRTAGFGHLTYQQFLLLVQQVAWEGEKAEMNVNELASTLLAQIRGMSSYERKLWEEIERKLKSLIN